jgi:hypothetical protein
MSTVALDRLRHFHARLERLLQEELSRPRPDDQKTARLKKQKLAARDRLLAVSGSTGRSVTA